MSTIGAFAHLPYVAIEPTAAPLAEGELVHLTFEEWSLLDRNFPYADRAYERSRPLFFHVERAPRPRARGRRARTEPARARHLSIGAAEGQAAAEAAAIRCSMPPKMWSWIGQSVYQ